MALPAMRNTQLSLNHWPSSPSVSPLFLCVCACSVFNNLKPAADLSTGSNYHIFKKGIAPKWEDPANAHGGRWIYTNPNKQKQAKLNELWLHAVLAIIGEVLEVDDGPDGEVCGISLNIRKKEDRLCVWTRNAKDKERTIAMG